MKDSDCIAFLQWALPQLHRRWPGYRKVRRQVCKRVSRRIGELGLESVDAYREQLRADPAEWTILDGLTRITISRFYRERDAFGYLCDIALPELHALASPAPVQVWSAGCAGGEEAYTLAIAAHERRIPIRIVATDSNAHQLERARRATYSAGCLKDLPAEWRESCFTDRGDGLVLRDNLRETVELVRQDLREEMPGGPFHLILCRYVVFMYFDCALQRELAERMLTRAIPGGFVALGKRESWPPEVPGLTEVRRGLRVYRVAPP